MTARFRVPASLRSRLPRIRLLPAAMVALGLAGSLVAGYHALDSWYLQGANAVRLRAEYGALAATRFSLFAAEALHAEVRRELLRVASDDDAEFPRGAGPRFDFRITRTGASFRGALPRSPMQGAIADAVRNGVLAPGAMGDARIIQVRSGPAVEVVVYRAFPAETGWTAHGFAFDIHRYSSLFAAVLNSRRLLPSGVPSGLRNEDAVAVEVRSAEGRRIFRSGPVGEGEYVSRESLPAPFADVVVLAAARKGSVAWLATSHLSSRMTLILWLIILSAIASVVAVRLAGREARLVQARTDFVSSVSHELRTPLAQVQLFLETLRLGRFHDDAQRNWLLDGMQREITRLTHLVNNVLQFSRDQRAGPRAPLERRATELGSYLEDVTRGFAPLAATRGARIETTCANGLAVPLAPDAFRQVILNLLDNAVKFGPEGQVIRIRAVRSGARAQVTIDDEGPGIPQADRTRVWQPFERGTAAAGLVATGSGIGLSVVRNIVHAHEGTVAIFDAPGRGARLLIDLPLADCSTKAAS